MNNVLKQIIKIANRLFCVPICASCGIRLSPFSDKSLQTKEYVCFCPECSAKWHASKAKMCPSCTLNAEKCICTPKFFNKYQEYIPSVCFFSPDLQDVASNAIITAKYKKHKELFGFVASELSPKIRELLDKKGIEPENLIVTWMPRQKKAVNRTGFDQGKILSKDLANELHAEQISLFRRKGGKEQKKLDKASRKENAERSIVLKKHIKINGKRTELAQAIEKRNVLIIDDIITSGATLRRGVLLLMPLKPENVICATVAKKAAEKRSKDQ